MDFTQLSGETWCVYEGQYVLRENAVEFHPVHKDRFGFMIGHDVVELRDGVALQAVVMTGNERAFPLSRPMLEQMGTAFGPLEAHMKTLAYNERTPDHARYEALGSRSVELVVKRREKEFGIHVSILPPELEDQRDRLIEALNFAVERVFAIH